MLRLLKALGMKPKHTLRCVLFVNEENGLRGAAVCRQWGGTVPLQHLFVIETDNGGFDSRGFHDSNRNHDATQRASRWSELFAQYGLRASPIAVPEPMSHPRRPSA